MKVNAPNKYFAFIDEQEKLNADFERELADPARRAALLEEAREALRRRAKSTPADFGLQRIVRLLEVIQP